MTANARRAILVIEDDEDLRTQMKWALADFDTSLAGDRAQALALFNQKRPAVVVLDLGLPPDPSGASEGLATMEAILVRQPFTKIIIAGGNEEQVNALRAVRPGAYELCTKPIDPHILLHIINRALHLHDLEEENRRVAAQSPSSHSGLVATSPQMMPVIKMIERAARADIGVLITGESGTGKDVVARAVHDASPRARAPFIAINCAAIPEALMERELFGHEKGAFVGAVKQTIGKIELAHTGTLFLDEIGDIPLSLQAKLLHFLQNRAVERIGGRQEIKVDVRVLAATNCKLEALMAEGTFREDLFYRLNEIAIHIPPLRDREGDAVVLAKHFLNLYAKPQAPMTFSEDALAAIASYPWPGNVRELGNRVRRSILIADGRMVTARHLDLPMGGNIAPLPPLRQFLDKADLVRAQAITEPPAT